MRINQYLAFNLGISRRKAEEPVLAGKVKLNGEIIHELFTQVKDSDVVEILQYGSWQKINQSKNQTILFYKPTFCVTTRIDPEKRRTIYDYLPKKFASLKSAGRLDFMSEGLLVLSSDGELIQELTHPSRNHDKKYLVGLGKSLPTQALEMMNKGGIELDTKILASMDVQELDESMFQAWDFLNLSKNLKWYMFKLSEGRNNQIRKVCQMFGVGVTRLIRVSQGKFTLTPELKEKKWLEVL